MKKKGGGGETTTHQVRKKCTEKLVKHPIIGVIHVTKIYVYNSMFLVNILQVL